MVGWKIIVDLLKWIFLGVGSVGFKLVIYLVWEGRGFVIVIDNSLMWLYNYSRYGLLFLFCFDVLNDVKV